MWVYVQDNGELWRPNWTLAGVGYSGAPGPGKNNPAYQFVKNIGPIPCGIYNIGMSFTHALKGPVCMRLEPLSGVQLCGRGGFMVHGDSVDKPGTASEGCIILARAIRTEIQASNDRVLLVVSTRPIQKPGGMV